MEETFRMWRLLRYLKDHQFNLIVWDNNGPKVFGNTKELIPDWLMKQTSIMLQTREPRVYRATLATQFAGEGQRKEMGWRDLKTKLSDEEFKKAQEVMRQKITDAQLRISCCLKAGFLEIDEHDHMLISFPLRGRKFATRIGLLKEWIIEDIGVLQATTGTAILAIGAVRWDWVKYLTGFISPWW